MADLKMRAAVEQKLASSILPRIAGKEWIGRTFRWRTYLFYCYGHELALALAGLGLSNPVVQLFSQDPATKPSGDFVSQLKGLPTMLLVACLVCAGIWVALRITVTQEKLMERTPLAIVCRSELGSSYAELNEALQQTNPLLRLGDVQVRAKESVDRAFKAGAWPWPIGPENTKVDQWIKDQVRSLCDKHEGSWQPLPAEERS